MKILVDTNIILDVLLDREPFSTIGAHLFSRAESGLLAVYMCATTVTTLHYLARKVAGAAKAQKEIHKLLKLFEVAPVNRAVLEAALDAQFSDFEDAVAYEAARSAGLQAIVTRNAADFKKARIPVYSAEEILKILDKIK